jgi:hypothetical protein
LKAKSHGTVARFARHSVTDQNTKPGLSKTTVLKIDFDTPKLLLAMRTPDHIGAIVRIHTELDEVLKHIAKAMAPPPIPPLQYASERIKYLVSMGLPEIRIAPASIINTVRNNFAHNNKQAFEAKDVSKLQRAIADLYDGREIGPGFEFVHRKKDSDHTLRYDDMDDKEKFCFLGFAAIAGVAAIEVDFAPGSFKQIA